MKRLTHNIVSGGSYLGWHLHLLEDDEQQLQLIPALDAMSPPRFWDSNKIIPMELTVTRVFADQNLDIPNPLGEELVAVSKPDGSEWKPLLDWLAVGGLYKSIAGPPRNNPRMIRIVSPALKSAM